MRILKILNFIILFSITAVFAQDQCKPIGWATRDGRLGGSYNVTGGGSASPITVKNFADLQKYASDGSPRVIYIDGTLGSGWNLTSGDRLSIGSNKTIIGLKPGLNQKFCIRINNSKNVILRNIVIKGPGSNAEQAWDNILIEGSSKNVWIDHCEFWDGQDGNADVVKGADNVSFTWCIFGYTTNGGHNLSNLIASSDNEPASENKLNITIMNSWYQNVKERTPRCRYGNIHVVNNLFTDEKGWSSSGAANGYQCDVRTENNHFIKINTPIKLSFTAGDRSVQESIGNIFDGGSGNKVGNGTAHTPPYEYKSFLVPANQVQAQVKKLAGATLASPTSCDANPPLSSSSIISSSSSALPTMSLKIPAINNCEGIGVNETKNAGFEESAYYNLDNTLGSSVKYFVTASSNTSSLILVRFANGGNEGRSMDLSVNSNPSAKFAFNPTGDWTNWQVESASINLKSGLNTLLLKSETADGGPNIDWLGFTGTNLTSPGCDITRLAQQVKLNSSPNLKLNNGFLMINGSDLTNSEVFVSDVNGKIIFSTNSLSNSNNIDLNSYSLKTGLYLVRVVSKDKKSQVISIQFNK